MRHANETGQRDIGHPFRGVSVSVTLVSSGTVRDMSGLVTLCPARGANVALIDKIRGKIKPRHSERGRNDPRR